MFITEKKGREREREKARPRKRERKPRGKTASESQPDIFSNPVSMEHSGYLLAGPSAAQQKSQQEQKGEERQQTKKTTKRKGKDWGIPSARLQAPAAHRNVADTTRPQVVQVGSAP